MKFKKGDRVEVLSPAEEKGVQGFIIALNDAECVIRITKAGEGHNTTKLIGKNLPYFHTDLKGI